MTIPENPPDPPADQDLPDEEEQGVEEPPPPPSSIGRGDPHLAEKAAGHQIGRGDPH
jgi:hypothetical protein